MNVRGIALNKEQYKELLSAQSKEVLIHLLNEYTSNVPEIKNDILADLGFLIEEEEIKIIKPIFRKEIRKNKSYGYIPWKGFRNIEAKASEIIALCDKRINQNYVKMPISVLLDLLEQLSKATQYTDADFVDITSLIHQKINECAEKLSHNQEEANRRFMVTTIIRYAKKNIWDDYSVDDFNLLGTITPLVTNKNKDRLLKAADELSVKHRDRFSINLRDTAHLIFKIKVCLQLGQIKQAEELLNTHLHNDEIRLFKINLSIEEKDFNQAEKLVLDIINKPKHENIVYLKPWYCWLDIIYKESHQVQKRINALKRILFLGDASAYKLLKELLMEDGFWEDEYSEIIGKICISINYRELAPILVEEKETNRLFRLVKQYPELLKNYGKFIYNRYPEETTELFKAELRLLQFTATDRIKYMQTGDYIFKYSTYGDKSLALKLCEEWKQKNIRRPALQEEVNNVITKIYNSK